MRASPRDCPFATASQAQHATAATAPPTIAALRRRRLTLVAYRNPGLVRVHARPKARRDQRFEAVTVSNQTVPFACRSAIVAKSYVLIVPRTWRTSAAGVG